MTDELFGPYRVESLLGRGGMGEVHRAFDTVKRRTVALKRLSMHLASDEEFQARFRRESEVAARLREAHVIPIHDFGEIDGRLFIDMRLVDGQDLGSVLESAGALAPERAVSLVSQVASALEAAHSDGLLHRDVKPSNVLVTGEVGDEFAYLVDFGVAVPLAGGSKLTATGLMVGTMSYMAPEMFDGSRGDHRVDVYSLACVLFELLTGRRPFSGDGIAQMMWAHVNAPPPRPSEFVAGLPVGFDHVIARGMAKGPEQRYSSAAELARDARFALSHASTPRMPVLPAVVHTPAASQPTAAPWPGQPSAPQVYGMPHQQPSHPSMHQGYGAPQQSQPVLLGQQYGPQAWAQPQVSQPHPQSGGHYAQYPGAPDVTGRSGPQARPVSPEQAAQTAYTSSPQHAAPGLGIPQAPYGAIPPPAGLDSAEGISPRSSRGPILAGVAVAVVVLLVVAGVVLTRPGTTTGSGTGAVVASSGSGMFGTYTDPQNRFTIAPPVGWTIDTSGADQSVVAFRSPTPASTTDGKPYTPNIMILALPSGPNLQAAVATLRQGNTQQKEQTTTVDVPALLPDGTPARLLGDTFTDDGTGVAHTDTSSGLHLREDGMIAVHDGMLYLAVGTTTADAWGAGGPVIDTVLHTLSFGPAPAPPAAYKDPQGRFSLVAPGGWPSRPPDTDFDARFVNPTPGIGADGNLTNSGVVVQVESAAGIDLAGETEKVRRAVMQSNPGWKQIFDEGTFLTDGTPAHLFGATASSNGGAIQIEVLVAVHGDRAVGVSGIATPDTWDSTGGTIDASLRSLTLPN